MDCKVRCTTVRCCTSSALQREATEEPERLILTDRCIVPDFSVPSSQLGVMRVSTLYPVKSICSQ
jgi:hypothetical protein